MNYAVHLKLGAPTECVLRTKSDGEKYTKANKTTNTHKYAKLQFTHMLMKMCRKKQINSSNKITNISEMLRKYYHHS